MPRYCAAHDCSNSVCYSGRPVHKFPSEPTLRKLWIRAARPSQPTWKPAKGDCLCTEHFEDKDYKTSPKLLQSLGLPVKQAYLKPGVVPSLFTRKRKRERHSGAVEKRRRKEVWNKKQNELFEQARGRELVLAGNGRSDSRGHSAKYGTYTVVDVLMNKVLHVETVQSNETKGSWAMELKGLKKTLVICEANGLTVRGIMTDRLSMIKSFLAKFYPQIWHMFDCWHVAKVMPRYCAAQDCSNSVCYSGRPVHKFPSEPTLRKLWIRAARPSQPTWKPAKGDCLCTEHFEDKDYKTSPKLLQSLGLPVKQAYLKPGVVPSLFTRKRKRERHSGAVEKRRRKEVWNKKQNELFEQARGRELVLAGNGRSDSRGHSAKYGTYTVVDVLMNKVLHVETVQSNETKGSWAMELKGLKKTLVICEANGLTVRGIMTDRLSMIKSFLAKFYPQIWHMFDCWHVAKAGKLKSLVGLQDCVQATLKHLYWCAEQAMARRTRSSPSGLPCPETVTHSFLLSWRQSYNL
ncbi:hypothetical protein ISCGN_027080 [Ixodes scapularis]